MKKIVAKSLSIYMLVGMLVAIIMIFAYQTFTIQRSNMQNSRDKLETVRMRLEENEEEIANITEGLGEDNLAKTRAFADIIAADSSFYTDQSKLNSLVNELMVEELNVIDENGIITHSNVEGYIGFDMGSGDQSAAFLAILSDPSLEIIQEPQENVVYGTLMQYVGVARTDAPGFVQVGIRPEMLENMLTSFAMDVVLAGVDFGNRGYVYAVDLESGLLEAHPTKELIGTAAEEAGVPLAAGSGRAKIDGTSGYYVSEEYNGHLIGTFLPSSEYYAGRLSQTLQVSVSLIVIFIILQVLINRMVDRKIVSGIQRIANAMKQIAEGDYSVRVSEDGSPEFQMLSVGINELVENMYNNMSENEQLLEKQKQDVESNYTLINNIKNVCSNLNEISNETLSSARSIHTGTEEQEVVVNDLRGVMENLVDGLNASADTTAKSSEVIQATVHTMLEGREQIRLMEQSIQKISDTSVEIEKIIGEINSIASQTNMLSLNASIEAARAGESGRGFAVVATQVGELAMRSSQAAKETNDLITSAIEAVEDGRKITGQTVEIFDSMAGEIERASDSVNTIADMVRTNVSVVSNAMDGLERISDVVKRNVEISKESEQTSITMAEEAGSLLQMVEP